MKYGDLASLYQLGVALNLGFGAVLFFAEPTKKQFERAISSIENRLRAINESHSKPHLSEVQIDRVFELNSTYMRLTADARYLSFEPYVWQNIPARCLFFLSALGSFLGLVIAAYSTEEAATLYAFGVAVGLNIVPMLAALVLLVGWCWYEYRLSPRVELLHESVFTFQMHLR